MEDFYIGLREVDDPGDKPQIVPKFIENIEDTYSHFDRGSNSGEAGPCRPCTSVFIKRLPEDLVTWYTRLILQTDFLDIDATLNDEATKAYEHINNILRECVRLRNSPELFHSIESRTKFLSVMAGISKGNSALKVVIKRSRALQMEARECFSYEVPARQMKRVGRRWMRIGSQRSRISNFHPQAQPMQRQWSKWTKDHLEGDMEWDAKERTVEQMMPVIGTTLIRRQRLVYGNIRRSYEQLGRITQKTTKAPSEFAHATGEDYTLLERKRALLTHDLMGFATGERKDYDENGVITIESLSKCIAWFQRRPQSPRTVRHEVLTITRA